MQQFVQAERGSGAIPGGGDMLPVGFEQLRDTDSRVKGLIGGLRNDIEKKFQPYFPGATLAHFLKKAIVVGAMPPKVET